MRHRTLGLTALSTGVGMLASIGGAHAQSYFDYYTTYNSGSSGDIMSSSAAPASSTDLPGPPNDETHAFFKVTPLQNMAGAAGSSGVNLLSIDPRKGTNSLFDTAPVMVNQTFTLKFTIYQTDSTGARLGGDSNFMYTGSWQGVLTNNSDSVNLVPVGASANAKRFSLSSGSSNYNVTLNPFTAPGLLGATNSLGILSATVDTSGVVAPEPGAMALLVGAVLPGAWFAFRLRRKRRP